MIWNFRDGGDGGRTAAQIESTNIAFFLFPIYTLLFLYFGLFNLFVQQRFGVEVLHNNSMNKARKIVVICFITVILLVILFIGFNLLRISLKF